MNADQLSMIEMDAEQLHDNITSRIKNDTNHFHCKGLICPITKKLTIDPVVGSDRIIYERIAFIKHCSDKSKTPVFSQVPIFIKEMISGYKRGIVYLVKPNKKESVIIISEGTDTGKLGYSKRSGFTRLKQYGSKATVLCVVQCDYYWMMEARLKTAFENEFDCLPNTKESFNGNLQAMQNLWLSVVSMMTTDLRSLDKKLICKFQQQQNGLPPRPQVFNANSDVPSLKRKREDVDTEECVDVYLVEPYHETNTLELSVMELGVNLAVKRQTSATNTICYVQRPCPGVLQELINEFRKEFTHVKENKYFKGNPQDMRVRWLSIVSNKILSRNNGSRNLYSQRQFKKQQEECKKKEEKQAKLTAKQAKLTAKQAKLTAKQRRVQSKQTFDFLMENHMKSSQEDGQSHKDIRLSEGFRAYKACCKARGTAFAGKQIFKQYSKDSGHECTESGQGRRGGRLQITGLRFNTETVEIEYKDKNQPTWLEFKALL